MTGALTTVGLALGGCAVGGVVGWVVGRRLRGLPLNALLAIVMAFAGGCYAAWIAGRVGDSRISTAGLGAAFGAMTAVKYASGLIPGLGPVDRAAVTVAAETDESGTADCDDC